MKVKYLGENVYNGFGLTQGKTYECLNIEGDWLRIIDDEGEDYLYPASLQWEIIEDKDNRLKNILKA